MTDLLLGHGVRGFSIDQVSTRTQDRKSAVMPDTFDTRETLPPEIRERALFAALRELLQEAGTRAPGWARILDGVEPHGVTSRAALAALPILRKSALPALQAENPPFGGLTLTPPGLLARMYFSPGPIADPEGRGRDWWGMARALHAVGMRAGDILHNSFSYHLTPAARMFESAAVALECATIPAGTGNSEAQLDAIVRFRPTAYAGTPDFLKILLDKAGTLGRDVSSLRLAVLSGAAFLPSLKSEFLERGVTGFQVYGTADLGLIAYESAGGEGLIVSEDLIVEIVRPGTGDPLPDGDVGEVVVTRINTDYPLFRLATGDLSAVMPGFSPCGRTGMRLKGWMGRADQTTKIKGMFVHPAQVAEIGRRHPEVQRLRLVVTRESGRDMMVLKAEAAATEGLADRIGETLSAVTKLRGEVALVAPGSLPNDGRIIADERPLT